MASTWLAASGATASAGGAGFAGSSGDAGPSGRLLAATQPPNSLPGIDVSHWQGEIDWPQVAASGQRFAIAKASEGVSYVDPMYATNRAGAMAAGLVFGAYHFARPDLHPNNPVGEADHYVDTAQLTPGNILPVLDLERQGDLTDSELTEWILDWLGEVTARTGVRPMVYTSPNGWDTRTGDTTAIADAGYTVLWVAHWGVEAPTVPANNWQGHGWTFWQYGDCGSVAGIEGCVDVDWYNGLDFGPVTIPSPDTVPPTATVAAPTGLGGPVTVSFDEVVRQASTDNVVLRVLDTGAPVPSTLACWSKKGNQVDCSTGNVIIAVLQPVDALVPGQSYAAIVNPSGVAPLVTDRSGNPAATGEQDFATPTQVEQGSVAVQYAWREVSAKKAFGSSYAVEHFAGAKASFTFSGNGVTWYTVTGPLQGRAAVSIDGKAHGTFDQYAASSHMKVARTFAHLGHGQHTITIRVLGRGSAAATDTQVAIDAFGVGGDVVRTPGLQASWGKRSVSGASGDSVAVNDLAGADATLAFRGTGLEWHTVRGPDQGRAQMFVDGALIKTVDNYASETTVFLRTITGLSDGVHELRIVVVGEARPKATDERVSIDAFTVLP